MKVLSDFLKEGVVQSISTHRNIDKLMGSGKIKDRHKLILTFLILVLAYVLD